MSAEATAAALRALVMVRESFTPVEYAAAARLRYPSPTGADAPPPRAP